LMTKLEVKPLLFRELKKRSIKRLKPLEKQTRKSGLLSLIRLKLRNRQR